MPSSARPPRERDQLIVISAFYDAAQRQQIGLAQ